MMGLDEKYDANGESWKCLVRIGEQGDRVYIGLRTENGNDADVVDDRLWRKEMT